MGVFPEACMEWKRYEDDTKTYVNFKVFFTQAHKEWCESQVTSGTSVYMNSAANCITSEALTSLATSMQSDHDAFPT